MSIVAEGDRLAIHQRVRSALEPIRQLLSSLWLIPTVALAIIAGALATFAIDEYHQTLEQEYRFLEAHARIAEARIDDGLLLAQQLLIGTADDLLTQTALKEGEVERRVRERLSSLASVDFLLVTDAAGRIVTAVSSDDLASERAARGFDASSRQYFRVHSERTEGGANSKTFHVSRPFKTTLGKMVFVVSAAIRGPGGSFKGVVAAGISAAYFDRVLSEVKPEGEGGAASLLNRQGDMLYHLPNPDRYVGSSVAEGLHFQAFVQSGERVLRSHGVAAISKQRRVFLFRWVGDSDLAIALSRVSDGVFTDWRGNLVLRGLIFIFAAAVILWLSWIAHRHTSALRQVNRQLEADIAAREQAEAATRLYASAFQHSGEAILICDGENRIVAVNDAFTRMTGYARSEIEGCNPRVLASGQTPVETYRDMWGALKAKGFWQGEIWDRRKDGAVYPKLMSVTAVPGRNGEIVNYVASFIDITERKVAEERIKRLAHHDSLTGLLNRVSLHEGLEDALVAAKAERRSLAVMYIDLDHFKTINDSLGHATGDELLIEVARRLRDCVRESDMVARLGGDEFVVVLTGVLESAAVSRVGEKILAALGEPYRVGGHDLVSTPSVGVAVSSKDGDTRETLMKHADAAMYRAKSQGRNSIQFFSELGD